MRRGSAVDDRTAAGKRVLRIKVTLLDTHPPVWRRAEVTDDITFAHLHDVLQRLMGWTDSHLHMFRVAGRNIGVPDAGSDVEDEKRIRLRDVADGVDRFQYDYDFGDDWQHEVIIEEIFASEKESRYPRCVAGKRACPPEDCGGVQGYAELIVALADPESSGYEEMREWAGDWEAERFDVHEVNRRLRAR